MIKKLRRLRHLTRALHGFTRARDVLGYSPTHIWIESTNKCNLQCIHCPTGTGLTRSRGHMDLALARRIIEAAYDSKPMTFFHLGGEPLLHPELPDIIRLAHEADFPTAMFTNGTILDRGRSKALIQSGLRWLGFSFDGLNKAVYEKVRKGGRFEDVLQNIFTFLELKREMGSSTPYTYMSVVDVWPDQDMAGNPECQALKSRLMQAGLNRLEILPSHSWGGLFENTHHGNGEFPRRPPNLCPVLWSGLSVLWDGTCVPCCIDIEGRLPLGNLKNQTLAEVWNGEPLRKLRRAFASRRWENLPPPCQSCHVPRQPTMLGLPVQAWANLKKVLLKAAGN